MGIFLLYKTTVNQVVSFGKVTLACHFSYLSASTAEGVAKRYK